MFDRVLNTSLFLFKNVYMRGLPNPWINREESIISFKIHGLVDILNLGLPKRGVCLKVDSVILNKWLPISFDLIHKMALSAAHEGQWRIKWEVNSSVCS